MSTPMTLCLFLEHKDKFIPVFNAEKELFEILEIKLSYTSDQKLDEDFFKKFVANNYTPFSNQKMSVAEYFQQDLLVKAFSIYITEKMRLYH